MRTTNKSYFAIFLISYLLIAAGVIVFKRTDLFPWIGECNPNGYEDGHFMAYCESTKYGDFEHWAYWNESDPVSMDAVKAADVLFLGNSRTQYAFSTNAIKDYFTRTDISHYVFGFGMGSLSPVPEKLIQKHALTPKVLIINADPFFSELLSGANLKMMKTDNTTRWEFNAKRWMQKLQKSVCQNDETWKTLSDLMCSGSNETLYREPKYGHWNTDYYRPNKKIPVTYTDSIKWYIDDAIPLAERFIENVGIKKSCVIVTVTPHTNTPLLFAFEVSKKLGVLFIHPQLKELKTIDDSHLDKDSAERWSAGFLEKAGPYIETCANDK
jgi:hypothetical protein